MQLQQYLHELLSNFRDTCHGSPQTLFYCSLVEIGAEFVETALTFVPALTRVPVLGRIILFLFPGAGGQEQNQVQRLQDMVKRQEEERKTRRERNNRYVLKASDAMECVEKNIMNGAILLAFGKGIASALFGGGETSAADVLLDKIWSCIESKTLRQDTPRIRREGRFPHRPSRGHGRGRVKHEQPKAPGQG